MLDHFARALQCVSLQVVDFEYFISLKIEDIEHCITSSYIVYFEY